MPFMYMRRHHKTVLWIMVIIIVPSFILYGRWSSRQAAKAATVGRVMGRPVYVDSFVEAFTRWRLVMLLQGTKFALDEQSMWNDYALVLVARRWGIRVVDSEVYTHVKQTFEGGKKFDIEKVQEYLQQRTGHRLDLPAYEKTVNEMLMRSRLLRFIYSTVKVTEEEARQLYRYENSTATVDLVKFDSNDYTSQVQVDPGELRLFFLDNRENYRIPEKHRLEYVVARPTDIQKLVKVSDDDLTSYYQAHKDDFKKPPKPTEGEEEEENPQDGEEEDDNTSRSKLRRDRRDRERGRNTETKEKKMLLDFRKEVETEYKPLAEVKETIDKIIRKDKGAREAERRIKALEDAIANADDPEKLDLKTLADDIGLTHATTPLLDETAIRRHPDLALRGPSDPVCKQELNAPSLAIKGARTHFVVRPLERTQSVLPELEEVKPKVTKDFRDQRSRDLALEAAQEFAALTADSPFDKVAEQQKKKIEKFGPFKRLDAAWRVGRGEHQLAQTIFKTPAGELTGAVLGNTAAFVAKVTDRSEPEWNEFDKDRKKLFDRYRSTKAQQALRAWIHSLDIRFAPPKSRDDA